MFRDILASAEDRLIPDLVGAPTWVWPAVAIGAVLVLLIAWGYFRAPARLGSRWLPAALKLLGVALLAFCLVEPLNTGIRPRQGANLFAILADNSQSMTITNPGERDTRAEQLTRLLNDRSAWRTRLEQDFDVRSYAFDTRLKTLPPAETLAYDGTLSGLRTSLETVAERLSYHPPAGMLLFSDGNATDLQAAVDWSRLGYPVFPVIDAPQEQLRDIYLENVAVTQTDFEASPVTVAVQVKSLGFAGAALVARLVDEAGKSLQEKSVIAPADDGLAEFRFQFRPEQSGVSFHKVEVFQKSEESRFASGDSPTEATLANNSRVVVVDRGGGPYRVLYISGRPNWEFKFLRRALDEDDEVQLVGLLRIARKEAKFTFRDRDVSGTNPLFRGFDPEVPEDVERYDEAVLVRLGISDAFELKKGVPSAADELFAYHAVILDDIEAEFFKPDQLNLLREFVSARGGGLLLLGGQEALIEGRYDRTPLGELAPMYLDKPREEQPAGPYRLDLTREGWLQPWLRVRTTEDAERKRLAEMPGFRTLNETGLLKPGASVLASVTAEGGQTVPALAIQRFGKGRTAVLLIGDLWRWAMHRAPDDDRDLEQAWRQVVRWLVADVPRRVEVRIEPAQDAPRTFKLDVVVRDPMFQPLDNAQVNLTVTAPDGKPVELTAAPDDREAGLYTVNFRPDQDGGYRVQAAALAMDGSDLGRRTSGFVAQPAAAEFQSLGPNSRLLAEIAEQTGGELVEAGELTTFVSGLPNRKTVVTERWTSPYWHQPWVLAFAIVLLCGEWGLRRWNGLP